MPASDRCSVVRGAGCRVAETAYLGFEEHGKGRIILGDRVRVRPFALLRTCGGSIDLGPGVVVGAYCVFHALGGITIGRGSLVSPQVGIYAQQHGMAPGRTIASQPNTPCPVVIGADVWIGAGAMILGPVTIGDGAVIGAGAVVTRDVPGGMIAGGNPAKVLRAR